MYTALLSLIPYVLFSIYFLIEVKALTKKMIHETSSNNILQASVSLEERTRRLNEQWGGKTDKASRELLAGELLDIAVYGYKPMAYILDTNGAVIAKARNDLEPEVHIDLLEAHHSTILDHKSGHVTVNAPGEKVHLLYMSLDKAGWFIAYLIPESRLMSIAAGQAEDYADTQVYKLVQRMSFFLFIGMLLILFFSYFFSEFFTTPIRQLTSALIQRAKGFEIDPLHTKRSDEIGELIHTFNYMDSTIQKLITELHSRSNQLEENVQKRTRDLQEANDLLQQTYSKLKRSEKSRSELIVQVSHDLKTPLTSMKGFLEILNKYALPQEQKKELIDQLLVQTNQIIQLIEGLFDLSSLDAEELTFQKEWINIEFIMDHALKTVFSDGEHANITLNTYYEDHLPLVFVDPKKIYRVFINILNNSIKYASNQPKIHIKITVYLNNKDIVIKMQDNGMGIQKENIDKVFVPYYRETRSVEKEIQGSGLGLSISKKMIEAHHGDIFIESEVNQGTTVYIMLPVVDTGAMMSGVSDMSAG
ncbi:MULTISPECIES: HAMP domain-containing sensor histidine kinase [Paenibacillus]|nr:MULTISPECIES: ATP-binding protein [Paenibacillus]